MEELGVQIEHAQNRLDSFSDDSISTAETIDNLNVDADSVSVLADQIATLEDRWFVAAEEMIHFDVGLLMTESILTAESPMPLLPFADESPSRLEPVEIAGSAFPHEQSILVKATRLPLSKLACTVNSFAKSSEDGRDRPILQCPVGHEKHNWLGSPALNSAGEVIGLYSRPMPSVEPNAPPDGAHCDVVSIKRVVSMLTDTE